MAEIVGTLVAHRYELKKVIGQGGQGIVCRALDTRTGRAVAIKMLTGPQAHKPEYAARLAREQQAMIALAGTSAVAVLDLCKAPNGALCLVMELLEGTDLEDHFDSLETRGLRMTPQDIHDTFDPIVDTLERAHDVGILHRDLKPGNIFLLSERAGGGVRLLDFGLSRMKTDAPLTEIGTVLGSPSYIAPEAWRGQPEEVDSRIDVYSFNVLVFRALTGRLPFEGGSLFEKFKMATTAPRPSLFALRPDLPPEIDAWAQQGLAIRREDRFATIRATWRALFKALRYTPTPRAIRPVADSLINAWRAATTAFRRFIDPRGGPASGPARLTASRVVSVGAGPPTLPTTPGPHSPEPRATAPSDAPSERPDRAAVLPSAHPSVFPTPEEVVDDDGWIDASEVEWIDEAAPSSRHPASDPRALIHDWLTAEPARSQHASAPPIDRKTLEVDGSELLDDAAASEATVDTAAHAATPTDSPEDAEPPTASPPPAVAEETPATDAGPSPSEQRAAPPAASEESPPGAKKKASKQQPKKPRASKKAPPKKKPRKRAPKKKKPKRTQRSKKPTEKKPSNQKKRGGGRASGKTDGGTST